MTNKINIVDNSEVYRPKVRHERVKKLTKRVLQGTGAVVGSALLVAGGTELLAAQPATPENTTEYTIQPGDTLTDIAVEEVPGGAEHVSETISVIRDMNEGLDPGNLQPGTEIDIPQ